MNVLLIACRPPDRRGKGDAKIAAQVVDTLGAAGHLVRLATPSAVPAIRRGLNTVAALGRGQPLQVGVTRSSDLQRRVNQILHQGEIDLIVAVHARATQYVPPEWRPRTVAFLYDAYGLAYSTYRGRVAVWLDVVYRLERRLMARLERTIGQQFGRVVVLAQPDWRYLRSLTPRAAIARIPYAVDLTYFSQTRRRPLIDPPLFIFVGRLAYIPNADAVSRLVTQVWPALRARWPEARLRIVGAQPGAGLRRQLTVRGVELAADVPDVRREQEEAAALLVPMRMGTGVQTKILEAMAAGLPVICSPFANAGLGAVPGEQVLIADTPADYVVQAERLLADPSFRGRLAEGARAWVAANHAPALFGARFMAMCSELAQHQPAVPELRTVAGAEELPVG